MMLLPTPSLPLLTGLASAILATVIAGMLALAAVAMVRRWHHDRFDCWVESLRLHYAPTSTALLEGNHSAQWLESLRPLPISTLELLLEPLLLECASSPALAAVLDELCLGLGLIDVWERRILGLFGLVSLREAVSYPEGLLFFLPGLRFLLRARGARNMGLLRHGASWPILVKALDDPHPDVQQAALLSLAAIQQPGSFLALLDRMHKSLAENRQPLSLHSVKAAMAKFPFSQAPHLLLPLRDPNPRIRATALEILREMAKSELARKPTHFQYKRAFDSELAALTSDADADVRVLAGEVIECLEVALTSSALRQMLQDVQWSVRSGALQTLAQRPVLLPMDEVRSFLADPHRMVRQAALRTLLAYGREGVSKLYAHFLETEDETLREEILEELEHSGRLLSLLQEYGESPGNLATRVVERLLTMGATTHLHSALSSSSGRQLLQILFGKPEGHSKPKIEAWVRLCTALGATHELDTADGRTKPAA